MGEPEKQSKVERKSIGKKLRFEVFKRDGFRCRYCGTTPDRSVMHVDHVLAVANGGTNEISNLVTACSGCNLGKGANLLTAAEPPQTAMQEQLEQIQAYVQHQRGMRAAEKEVVADAMTEWRRLIGKPSAKTEHYVASAIRRDGQEMVFRAIEITGFRKGEPSKSYSERRAEDQGRYFSGVLRKLREEL